MIMSAQVFYRQLGIVALLTAAALWLLGSVPLFAGHQLLYWMTFGVYLFITLLLFWIGRKLAGSSNKNSFTQFVMITVFAKMALTMAVLVAYLKMAEPTSKYFILPFFVVYLAFTIYETYMLMKAGRIKPAS
jgi:putative effector of murein hydrolase